MIDNTGMTAFEKKVDVIDLCNEKSLPDAKPGYVLFQKQCRSLSVASEKPAAEAS